MKFNYKYLSQEATLYFCVRCPVPKFPCFASYIFYAYSGSVFRCAGGGGWGRFVHIPYAL